MYAKQDISGTSGAKDAAALEATVCMTWPSLHSWLFQGIHCPPSASSFTSTWNTTCNCFNGPAPQPNATGAGGQNNSGGRPRGQKNNYGGQHNFGVRGNGGPPKTNNTCQTFCSSLFLVLPAYGWRLQPCVLQFRSCHCVRSGCPLHDVGESWSLVKFPRLPCY